MTSQGSPPLEPADDAEEAAAWWDVKLRSPSCSEEDRQAFDQWRQARPDHADAFDQLQTSLRILRASRSTDPHLRAVRERARGAVAEPGRRWRIAAAAVIALGLLASGPFIYRLAWESPKPPSVYRTLAGERSTLHLADGSVVTLNSNTEVHVAFKKKLRDVALISGEAAFKVAKDPTRPFSVAVGPSHVVAVGTAFNIRVEPSEMRVTMIEGRVEVAPAVSNGPTQKRLLVAGQRLTARTDTHEVEIAQVNVANETAWLENKISFHDDPLSQAVDRYNQYSGQMIRIGDPSISNIPVSGMFKTNQPETFLDALTSYYDLKTARLPTGEVVLTRK